VIKRLLRSAVKGVARIRGNKTPLSTTPAIENNSFLFLAGLHRSGTSILHRLLREHPGVSGFANTGVPEDEGQHLQSVFPAAHKHGGPGSFAFDFGSHLTEESNLINQENIDQLLREWCAYYDLNKKLLIEKSPPNLVRSRFFQAMFPGSCFVFIVRHPVTVALATQKWTRASVTELLLHWHVAHSIMLADLRHIKNYMVIRYEDFIESPQLYFDKICNLLELEQFTPMEKVENYNLKYFQQWEQNFAIDSELIEAIFPSKQSPMEIFGYNFKEPYVGKNLFMV